MTRFIARCSFALALCFPLTAEAKQDVEAPAKPADGAGGGAVAAEPAAPVAEPPGPELPSESDMYSVGMFAGGIALVVGGIVNSAIGIGVIAATTSSGGDGFGGVFALIIGAPILFDGTVQISVGIPMIVVGGADAEPLERAAREATQVGRLPTRNGLTLAVPF